MRDNTVTHLEVDLLSLTPCASAVCGLAASTCTNSSDTKKSLMHALASGHESVIEHASFTFRIRGLSRAALAQLTRHRLASFDVMSQRYVRYEDVGLVIPESILDSELAEDARYAIDYAIGIYQRMADAGIPLEDARYVLPQAVTTELVLTMNARELRHFFSLRCCNRAQWEIRELADEMLKICRKVEPDLFENAGPGCVTGRCPEKRPCGNPRRPDEWSKDTGDSDE